MKEKLYTIPLNDAINADDECPFCFLERILEQDLLDFVLGSGSSYMESDIREATDNAGFCRLHLKKMFDYGNTLGNAWILKTHFQKLTNEFEHISSKDISSKTSIFSKKKESSQTPITTFINEKKDSCYICNEFKKTYPRYLDTFLILYQKDIDFRTKVKEGKGFCLVHFGDLYEYASDHLSGENRTIFLKEISNIMYSNMCRLEEELSWLIDKFDYRNKDADWKNSKDALQRGMQKLKGSYPSDPIYKMNK
ncbi:MAG: DUF6062 family protein [Lachnospiraceae bacterium]